MATLLPPTATNLSVAKTDLYQSLLHKSFLFSVPGTQEDYAHQLLELNGLTCQLNQLFRQTPNSHCAQSALGVIIPKDLTSVDAYQLGKELGEQEYQNWAAFTQSQTYHTVSEQLIGLMNWWSQSYLEQYGQLLIDVTDVSNAYIRLQVINAFSIKLKKTNHQPDCAFYAGILAGFFSGLAGRKFEVIEPDCEEGAINSCQFLLAPQPDLNAMHFWQTLDHLSH